MWLEMAGGGASLSMRKHRTRPNLIQGTQEIEPPEQVGRQGIQLFSVTLQVTEKGNKFYLRQ